MKLIIRHKGGPGSGFYGHVGRPGQVGGSQASNTQTYTKPSKETHAGLLDTRKNPFVPGAWRSWLLCGYCIQKHQEVGRKRFAKH
jgi:hypothetical protein